MSEKDVVNSPELFLEEWDPQKLAAPRYGSDFEWTWRRCELAAAAPKMVQLLVELEWADEGDCLVCSQIRTPDVGALKDGHEQGCPLDAALTAAGLSDQASRDKLRELIEERSG